MRIAENQEAAAPSAMSCELGAVTCTTTTQGSIFAVSYQTRVPRSDDADDIVNGEKEEAAKRIVRYCDALFDTFLRGIRAAVESNKHLFDKEST